MWYRGQRQEARKQSMQEMNLFVDVVINGDSQLVVRYQTDLCVILFFGGGLLVPFSFC
jgi:hypothetical protein